MRASVSIAIAVLLLTQVPGEASAKPRAKVNASCQPLTVGDAPSTDTAKQQLNTQKNRTALPSSVENMQVDNILAIADQPDPSIEARGVYLEGYLLGERHEGPESPNCHSPTRRDFHMWMGGVKPTSAQQGMQLRDKAVVVEPTPNLQEKNLTWTETGLASLVGKHIRVMGWLMYDPEHPDQLGQTRGTLWEIHLVMRIEVEQPNGTWKKF
jgi:hypothetical protein